MIALSIWLLITVIFRVHVILVLKPVNQESIALHLRRLARARAALNSAAANDWNYPMPVPEFPFAGWVELLPDGRVRVADQTFSLKESCKVVARDTRNLPRAGVICEGSGVRISSHGQVFLARFQATHWIVELIEPNSP